METENLKITYEEGLALRQAINHLIRSRIVDADDPTRPLLEAVDKKLQDLGIGEAL